MSDFEPNPTTSGKIQTTNKDVSHPLSNTSKESQNIVPDSREPIPSTSKQFQETVTGTGEPLHMSNTTEEFKNETSNIESIPCTSKQCQGIPDDNYPIPSTYGDPVEFIPVDVKPLNPEEYQTFIPGIGDTFPYFRDEAEFRLIYEIPKTLLLEEANYGGKVIELQKDLQSGIDVEGFTRYFFLKCYPNGDCKENEGYVSFIFEEIGEEVFFQLSKLNVTLTLLDVDKNSRFPQSLSLDHNNDIQYRATSKMTFGISRYMGRDALLSSDLFCDEKLLLQCEVQFYTIENVLDEGEPPFVLEESYDETGNHITLLLDVDHFLWTVLCEESPYFHKLIVTDKNTELSMFDDVEYQAFDIIVKCIMSGVDPGMFGLSIQKVFYLYEYSDYILFNEFRDKCGDLLKERMTPRIVCNVIAMADMHSDADLKKFAIQYAVENWRRMRASKSWDILNKERPDLAKEVNEFKSTKEGPRTKKRKRASETDTEYVQQFQYYQ